MAELTEIEQIQDLPARVAAYARFLNDAPEHSRAWSNYAVDLVAATRWAEARRAAMTAVRIEPTLRERGPDGFIRLVRIGGIDLVAEVISTPAHVVYRGVRTADGQPVLVRGLPGVSIEKAASLFGHHEVLTRVRRVPHLVRALGTETGPDDQLYQVLEHVRGQLLLELFRGGQLPPADASTVVAEVARALAAVRAAEIEGLELRPEFLVRADDHRDGVIALGPLERRADPLWLAPEERGGALGPAGDLYRLGLLLQASAGGALPTPGHDGARTFARPAAWSPFPELAEAVAGATRTDPAARPALDALTAAIARAVGADDALAPDDAARIPGLRLRRKLGEGRFAVVWEADDAGGQRVAVKILRKFIAADGELRLRFLNEAKIAGGIDHPGVVKVLERGVTDDEHYLIMELCRGGTLADRLVAGALDVPTSVDVGIQIADAMAAVHDREVDGLRIVHRDLKPSNLFLVDRQASPLHLKVSDFGAAKLAGVPTEAGIPLTSIGRLMGTPEYMAPEQWMMIEDIDRRTDVYGLGVVLYECLTGAPPFAGKNDYELQQGHIHRPVPPLVERGVPVGLARIVERMLHKDREQRFPDMTAVAAALRAWRDEQATATPEPPEPPPPPPNPPIQPPRLLPEPELLRPPIAPPPAPSFWDRHGRKVAVGLPLAVVAAGLGWFALSHRGATPVRFAADAGVDNQVPPIDANPRAHEPCGERLYLEWAQAVGCADAAEVWLYEPSNDPNRIRSAGCKRRLWDLRELESQVHRLQHAGAAGQAGAESFAALGEDLLLRTTPGFKHIEIGSSAAPAAAPGLRTLHLYVSFDGDGGRDGMLRVEDGASAVFLSRAGYWCKPTGVDVVRATLQIPP